MKNYLLVFLLFLSACSTSQKVTIYTPEAEGAECELNGYQNGNWKIEKTPAFAEVSKENEAIVVECRKSGFWDTTQTVFLNEETNSYPEEVVIWMEPERWKSKKEKTRWEMEKKQSEEKNK